MEDPVGVESEGAVGFWWGGGRRTGGIEGEG